MKIKLFQKEIMLRSYLSDEVEQFLKNISDVVKIFENKKIPIFIGTIASNLKDQTPLGDSPEVLKTYQKACHRT